MQVPCTQCGGSVELVQGIRFFVCSYCKSALYLDPSGVVFHFVVSPLIPHDESLGKLKRWMAGNETAKDLDIRSTITHHDLIYFPMWRFVTRVNGADLGNRVDHVLCGKIRFFSDQTIALVMDVVSAMQVLLKGEFGKGVAGTIELFHGGFEFLRGVSR